LSPDLLADVISCVGRAGEILATEFRRVPRPRGHGDKAEVDHEIELMLRERLLALLRCRFVGEETGTANEPGTPFCWLVDPHDGTRAFLQGHRGSAVSVALLQVGVPVLGVVYAPLSPDRGPDLVAWAAGMNHLLRNGDPVTADLSARVLTPGDIVFLNHEASSRPIGNGRFVHPGRFVSLPSIAYRLARVAVGNGVLAVSLSGPGALDYAAGHALLVGAGGALLDEHGQPVSYTMSGHSSVRACFGGAPAVAREVSTRMLKSRTSETRGAPRVVLTWPRRANEAELDRAAGCLLGQVIGDSLGSLVEFKRPEEIARQHPGGVRELQDGGVWNTFAGQPTDDSELALAFARTLTSGIEFDAEAVADAYGRWHASNPFDIGTTTRAAMSAAARAVGDKAGAARKAALRHSQSNGSLMRVSAVGVWARDPDLAAHVAIQDSGLTHPHPACATACAAYAVAIAVGIAGADTAGMLAAAARIVDAHRSTAPTIVEALEGAQAGRRPECYTRDMGHVAIAFQNAFYHLAHTRDFEAALVDTVGRGGDTDTNGAMAGALLGAAMGRRAISARWTTAVMGCRPIEELGALRPRPSAYWPDDVMALAEALLVARQET
jgi:ADP-ribosylglycohydrolase/fructose-1,6-bisphosphatase/inositol monophosphatase family enzyme